MDGIEIIKATPTDAETLHKLSRQTFADTYSWYNTAENMKSYMEEFFSVQQLSKELNDPNCEYYFARLGTEFIGYFKLNFGPAQTELKDENAVEIERIYVQKEYHGRQVAQQLCRAAIQRAQAAHADYIWLGVWEQNPRAISFYRKMGFTEFGTHPFIFGTETQTDILMKLRLNDGQ